ncbi:TadE/TadG family type IV pilus assembly protein [Rhizorhapis sp. SPR117]|uniref:TadE/TadG family type IV pilus assembly protein n=1 Tax=Rhizorhapis sp. SPR117 TaxID=2912611 RepID=UPI001F37273E|nr:pilus assembly protein [Rhizorhapis sp. SPR117]
MRAPYLTSIISCSKASSAAEMALVTPLLIILMFGAFELGNYFLSEHVVVKSVRDGARYASRQGFSNFTCPSTISSGAVANIQNVTRTGKVAGGSARLAGWTNNATVTVALTCTAIGSYSGIYKGMTNIPVVTVSATVPYNSLFNSLGFSSSSLSLNAESQSAVMGI